MRLINNSISTAGVTLGAFALLSVILLGSIQWLTKDNIAENARQRNLLKLHEIIAPNAYDNDLLGSKTEKKVSVAGLAGILPFYTAHLKNNEVARIYSVRSLEGYSGAIDLLIGINSEDQRLLGVRVTSHKETPGLGDKIETSKSDWIFQFEGKSLNLPTSKQWKVKKDGGVFDQFTGATITPRAVVNAVRETLKLTMQEQAENE